MEGRKLYFILLLIFSVNSVTKGQSIKTSFDNITGFSQSTGNYIIQDQNGFIWVATFGGINKYDGYNIKTYERDVQDSTSISYDGSTYLFEDRHGYIWVANNSSRIGLDRFDPRTDIFTHYKFDETDSTSISSNMIFHIMEDKNGSIWICTDNALNLVIPYRKGDYSKVQFQRYYYPESRIELSGTGFSMAYEDQYDNLLLISPEVFYFNRESGKFIDAKLDLDIALATSVADDGLGNLWIGTSENGLIKISYDESTSSYLNNPIPTFNTFENDLIFVTNGKRDDLWIGSEAKGLYRYDPDNEFIEHFPHDENDPKSIRENSVRSLFVDHTGVLWIGTLSQEVCKTDLNQMKFIHYKNIPGNSNSLGGNLIAGMSGIQPNELWVGSRKDGGLSRFLFNDGQKPYIIQYFHDPKNEQTIGGNHVLSVFQRKNGDVWLGSVGEIITHIIPGEPGKGSSDIFNRYYVLGWTFVLYENSDSVLWGGTWNEGLWRLNDKEMEFDKFHYDPLDTQSICSNIIWGLGEDHNKNLWIGSNGHGLSILPSDQKELDNPKFINYRSEMGNLNSISHNTINVFYQDKNGTMWIGTNGGLNQVLGNISDPSFSLHELKFKSFTTKDGLSDNDVLGIMEDKTGNLWLSTSNGLSMFDLSDSTFKNYYESDGLQSNIFLHNGSYQDSNGRFFIGSPNGINAFYPEDIKPNPFKPQIAFTDIKIWNKSVKVGEEINGDMILPTSLNEIDEIFISHQNNAFSIEFAALHFAQPYKNKYAYYLEGFDENWNFSDNQRSATYTNLNPGTYVFHVKGSNNNGVWNETGKSLTINILPPWWGTLWFRFLIVLLLIAIVILTIYSRTRNLLKQKVILERKVIGRTNQLNNLIKELQEKQDEVETTNEELTSTLEDLFAQKTHVEKINYELEHTQEELKTINSQLDQRVQERTSKLVKANRELDRFVYSASHDLSAPLKSIIGLINIASLERKKIDLANHLKHMEKSVLKLENVIKSLTQYSRNSGHEIIKEDFIFDTLTNEVLEEVLGPKPSSAIKIFKDFEPNQIINSDFLRLKIVLANLISNAIKYKNKDNSESFVKIGLRKKNGQNIISVKDNGIGIDEEYIHKIFNMFYRATTLSNGSGLGLYIVKETIDRLNGEINLNSIKGELTEVEIILPD